MSAFKAFHWPDHVIGKRESRRIREEHNALYNSHAELLAALKNLSNSLNGLLGSSEENDFIGIRQAAEKADLLIAKAEGAS